MTVRYLRIDCTRPEKEGIQAIAEMIHRGGVIVYPTDTVYGLGCDANNADAVKKVNRLKSRAPGRPLLVLIPGLNWISRLAGEIPPDCHKTISSFWPGPLTLVLKASPDVPQGISGEGRTIGLRWADQPFLQALLDEVQTPIISTSANISGREPLRQPGNEQHAWLQNVDMVVDGGPLRGLESTILDFSGPSPKLLREGATLRASLQAILGPLA